VLEPRSWLNCCGQETHFDLDSQKDAIGDHHESGEHVESIVFHNPAGVSCVFFLEIQFGFNSVLKQSTLQKKTQSHQNISDIMMFKRDHLCKSES